MHTDLQPARRRLPTRLRHAWGAALALGALVIAGCSPPLVVPVTDPGVQQPLHIPPLAESRVEDGVRIFSLTAQQGSSEFLPGIETPTWGFNGDHLGPTIRAERGERVAFEITNELSETTTVHWHGMHLPASMDGGPFQAIAPGGTWEPHWDLDQPAATLWYHPHPHGATERHVYHGLAGLFLIDDALSRASTLPSQYGVDDIPAIVQDMQIGSDGRLFLNEGAEPGTQGDLVMVNGTLGAFHEVTTELVRLRLLNGSTARTYDFGFEDRDFELVATDGGLLPSGVELSSIRLSPGERAEILVRMEPDESATLRSAPPDLGNVASGFSHEDDSFDVLELRAGPELEASADPVWEHEASDLMEDDAEVTRSFELTGRRINGERMDMERIDFAATVDSTEIWEVSNGHRIPHNFHVHDVQFEVLTVDGEEPPPELSGRKDTIFLEPGVEYRLIMRFEHYTDPDLPYMFHCHMLLHEDEGMMGQFVVVEEGQEPGTPPVVPQHAH